MIKIRKINENELNKLRENNYSMDKHIHPFTENYYKKIYKEFKSNDDIDSKIITLDTLSRKGKNEEVLNKIILPDELIEYKGKITGYVMPQILYGKSLINTPITKKDSYKILKIVSEDMKIMNDNSIRLANILFSTMIDMDGNIYYISPDTYGIDSSTPSLNNRHIKTYCDKYGKFDEKGTNYLLNCTSFILLDKSILLDEHSYENEKVDQIYKNTIHLPDFYDEGLLIDEIQNEKQLKKLKHKR